MSSLAEYLPGEKEALANKEARWIKNNFGTRQLLVLHGKHEPLYYFIGNLSDLHQTTLAILQMHYEDQMYADTLEWAEEDPPEAPEIPKGTEFANKRMQRANDFAWEDYAENVKMHKSAKHFARLLEIALRNKDGWLAYELIRQRSTHEYERVTLHQFQTLPA